MNIAALSACNRELVEVRKERDSLREKYQDALSVIEQISERADGYIVARAFLARLDAEGGKL